MELNTGATGDGGGAGAHDFRQLAILREFSNIANAVGEEEFLGVMPTSRLKQVKWLQLLKVLRERVRLGVASDWGAMWEEEGLTGKLEALERQREKYSDASRAEPMWRPELANVKAQLKANDAAILLKKKHILELEAKDYEIRVGKLKKTILAKRGYIRAVQLDIQKCQKKNNELYQKLEESFEMHSELAEEICPLEDSDGPLEI